MKGLRSWNEYIVRSGEFVVFVDGALTGKESYPESIGVHTGTSGSSDSMAKRMDCYPSVTIHMIGKSRSITG